MQPFNSEAFCSNEAFENVIGGGECLAVNRELTEQDSWNTQDGRMTKRCRVTLEMHSLSSHFSSFYRPESSSRPVA